MEELLVADRQEVRLLFIDDVTNLFTDYIKMQMEQAISPEVRAVECEAALTDVAIVLSAVPIAVFTNIFGGERLDLLTQLVKHIHEATRKSVSEIRMLRDHPVEVAH